MPAAADSGNADGETFTRPPAIGCERHLSDERARTEHKKGRDRQNMKTIAIINQKGGTGKTTTAREIGAGLSLKGHRVLMVDLDPQHSLTYIMGETDKGTTIADLLQQSIDAPQIGTAEAIRKTARGDLIAGSGNVALADTVLADVDGREYKIAEILQPIKRNYDFCILDTPPTLGTLTVNALTAAQMAIAPAQADALSLIALGQLQNTTATVKRYCNPDLVFSGIVLTRYNGRAVISRDIAAKIEQAAQQIGARLYRAKIRECTAIKEAELLRQSIFDYAPRSNAAADYAALVDEILTA